MTLEVNAMKRFSIVFEECQCCPVVRLVGEADHAAVADLEGCVALLLARRAGRVVLDLSRLTFISSLSLGLLVSLRTASRRWGGTVVMAGARGDVSMLLERCRLYGIMPVYEELEEALV